MKRGPCVTTMATPEVFPFPSNQQQVLDLKEALLERLRLLIWRYGCPSCNFKANGLLCASCFGRTRRDIKKIVAYLAAAGKGGE
jgi:hypothetical protein